MTASLSGLFRSLFPAITLTLCLIVLGGAGAYYLSTGAALTAAVLAFAGLALVVALFGLVALQIENNELLYRIAIATEGQGWAAQPQEAPTAEPEIALPQATMVASRMDVAVRAVQGQAASRGRVEPVVTLRGQPAPYGA